MSEGSVIWFKNGYGFVRPDNGVSDLFVHFKGIAGEGYRTLNAGDRVQFDTGTNKNGPCAINVTVVE